MTKRTWPSVTNRNVAQPSRVRLVNAPDAGSDVFDVIPVPGSMTDEGTLLNKALFDAEKAYVDQNDIPLVITTGTSVNYVVDVPEWAGLSKAELDGKLLLIRPHVASTTTLPLIEVSGKGTFNLACPNGIDSQGGSALPSDDYIQTTQPLLLKFQSQNDVAMIIGGGSKPFGGEYVNTPWAIAAGGTGANTAAGARANLSVPASYMGTTDNLRLAKSDGNFPEWISVGKTSVTTGGLLPNAPSDTGNQHIGTSSWPFIDVWAKTLNGSLAASSITGVLPVSAGGTGANTESGVIQNLKLATLNANGISIGADTDLDTLSDVNTYHCHYASVSQTILNTPWGSGPSANARAFKLEVLRFITGKYLVQILQSYEQFDSFFIRYSYDNGATWYAWQPYGKYKAGTNITIDADGTINAIGGGGGGGDYVLPKATATVLGGIKVGSGLNVATDGTLSTALTAPVSIANGGTGTNTAAGARTNLSVPTFGVLGGNEFQLKMPDGTPIEYLNIQSGILPETQNVGYVGVDGKRFGAVYANVLNGTLAASNITGVLPISAGGTGGNTAALSRANLGAPSYSLASTGDMSMLTSAGEPVDWISSGNQTTNTGGFMPRVSMSSTGWGSVGTSTYPFAHLYAKNLHGTLSVNDIDGIIPTYRGGTGANTPAAARTNLGIPGTYATGTGTDAQITSAYYIAPKTMVIDMLINVSAINGANAIVDAGSVTLPVAIRGAVVSTSAGFDTVQAPNPAITGGGQALFNFTIVNNRTLKINGWLQSGQNIAKQRVNAQIIIPVA